MLLEDVISKLGDINRVGGYYVLGIREEGEIIYYEGEDSQLPTAKAVGL